MERPGAISHLNLLPFLSHGVLHLYFLFQPRLVLKLSSLLTLTLMIAGRGSSPEAALAPTSALRRCYPGQQGRVPTCTVKELKNLVREAKSREKQMRDDQVNIHFS